jgi:hypothetical protein
MSRGEPGAARKPPLTHFAARGHDAEGLGRGGVEIESEQRETRGRLPLLGLREKRAKRTKTSFTRLQ